MKLFNSCVLFLTLCCTGCASHLSSEEEQATYQEPKRLLLLDGDDGSIACRIYGGLMSATIPRFSNDWILESATRSLLRMKNLTAVRGIPGASMVGPIDYFGNLAEPHKYLYTIEEGFPPVFHRRVIGNENRPDFQAFDDRFVTVIKATWISGKEGESIKEKKREYRTGGKDLKHSLFRDPGLLEVDRSSIELLSFDPRGVDLSSFRARLVDNKVPFNITKRELPSKDDYRLVTYLYEPNYAQWQVESGSGLFLEKHRFSQTITPIEKGAGGFVALARTNETPDELEIVGIQIPYGYTLIIEEGCIHGDTTLKGLFMMGMTSDHTTMRTADTVFLKDPETKENVAMVLAELEGENHEDGYCSLIPPPYVIYKDATETDRETFRSLTKGKRFIFNPFSREYWRW